MTLYLCPEADREKWIAEIDLPPFKASNNKIAVCSLQWALSVSGVAGVHCTIHSEDERSQRPVFRKRLEEGRGGLIPA